MDCNRIKKIIIEHYTKFLIGITLVSAILIVYWPVHDFEFISFDDEIYVTDNPRVQKGITWENTLWAFDINDKEGRAYWHPLTWLSHMLDCEMFGLNAGMHHLTSLGFHIANSLLLFLVFQYMTGALWQSAFVAALFAVHPINVDSVAWIAERKNVLSTFFWLLTMLSYVYYARRPGILRYLLVFFLMALGLMAKPMLVTLPCVFLLLDFWPMNRFLKSDSMPTDLSAKSNHPQRPLQSLIWEKIPFFLLSIAIVIISFHSLHQNQSLISETTMPLDLRIFNAIVIYIKYIYKLIWPNNLAFFYPFPESIPPWQIISASGILLGVTAIILSLIKKAPYLFVGWFWFLGTLFPVIGLIQGGVWPEMADRWAYVPAIGIFTMIAWGGAVFLFRLPYRRMLLSVLAAMIIMALVITARIQTSHWENSISLFEHALKVTGNNWLAHNNLGNLLNKEGRFDEAIFHYKKALHINPKLEKAFLGMGVALIYKGRVNEGIACFRQALKLKPDYALAKSNLQKALLLKK